MNISCWKKKKKKKSKWATKKCKTKWQKPHTKNTTFCIILEHFQMFIGTEHVTMNYVQYKTALRNSKMFVYYRWKTNFYGTTQNVWYFSHTLCVPRSSPHTHSQHLTLWMRHFPKKQTHSRLYPGRNSEWREPTGWRSRCQTAQWNPAEGCRCWSAHSTEPEDTAVNRRRTKIQH